MVPAKWFWCEWLSYGVGHGVKKDLMKRAEYYLETFNRVVHCCALRVRQYFLEEKHKYNAKTLNRVVKGLLRWAVALDAKGAKAFLEKLYNDGVLERSPAFAAANFKSVPPWLAYK